MSTRREVKGGGKTHLEQGEHLTLPVFPSVQHQLALCSDRKAPRMTDDKPIEHVELVECRVGEEGRRSREGRRGGVERKRRREGREERRADVGQVGVVER